jgi:hypothetical protein
VPIDAALEPKFVGRLCVRRHLQTRRGKSALHQPGRSTRSPVWLLAIKVVRRESHVHPSKGWRTTANSLAVILQSAPRRRLTIRGTAQSSAVRARSRCPPVPSAPATGEGSAALLSSSTQRWAGSCSRPAPRRAHRSRPPCAVVPTVFCTCRLGPHARRVRAPPAARISRVRTALQHAPPPPSPNPRKTQQSS